MTDVKQIVCDRFAEKVLTDLFGKTKVPAVIDLFLRNRGFDVQQKFDLFDSFIREFMNDEGKIRADELKKFVAEYLPNDDFYLQDKWEEMKLKAKKFIGG